MAPKIIALGNWDSPKPFGVVLWSEQDPSASFLSSLLEHCLSPLSFSNEAVVRWSLGPSLHLSLFTSTMKMFGAHRRCEGCRNVSNACILRRNKGKIGTKNTSLIRSQGLLSGWLQ